MYKKISLLFVVILMHFQLFSQSISDDKVSLSNYIKRMYENLPFDGVKVLDDSQKQYLVSVISLDKKKYNGDVSTMSKVSKLKAQSQMNSFLNGSIINSEMIIKTTENKDSVSTITIEQIKESANGHIDAIELLSNFEYQVNKLIFIYIKPLK